MKTEPMPQELSDCWRSLPTPPRGRRNSSTWAGAAAGTARPGGPVLQTELPAGFRKEAVEAVKRFALACWMQGQDDGRAGV